jgi:hypothetical protein
VNDRPVISTGAWCVEAGAVSPCGASVSIGGSILRTQHSVPTKPSESSYWVVDFFKIDRPDKHRQDVLSTIVVWR